jgi:hypothetical protein
VSPLSSGFCCCRNSVKWAERKFPEHKHSSVLTVRCVPDKRSALMMVVCRLAPERQGVGNPLRRATRSVRGMSVDVSLYSPERSSVMGPLRSRHTSQRGPDSLSCKFLDVHVTRGAMPSI